MLMYMTSSILTICSFLSISIVTGAENSDRVDSEWPSGSYAVPMTIDGCPEDADMGWRTSYLKMTMKYPMDKLESYSGCLEDAVSSNALENFTTAGLKHISWVYNAYTLQLNFCYKTTEHQSDSNASWPIGNYSIYGVKDECPHGFESQSVNICLPQILAMDYGGYIPFVTFGNTKTNNVTTILQVSVCTRNSTDSPSPEPYWPETHPFSSLGIPGQECPSILRHRTSREMLPIFFPIIDSGVFTGQQMEFCYFMPNFYRFGVRVDYGMEQHQTLRTLFKDCRGLLYVTPHLEDYSCSKQITGSCDKPVQITLDAGKIVGTSGVMLKFDRSISYYTFLNLFANSTLVFTADGTRICRHNETAWKNSDTDLNIVFTCIRMLNARRFTLIFEVEHDWELLKKTIGDVFVTLLSCTSGTAGRNVSSCQSELGMRDLGIQDFQLSASSSQIYREPMKARPQYNGWCAARNDKQPYLQIDLLSVTVVEGIVIYNWVENSFENVYKADAHIRGCHSFHIEHGVSQDEFMQITTQPFVIDKSCAVEEPRTILFYEPFSARYVRVYPFEHDNKNLFCLKLEVLGCRKPGTLSLNCHQRQHREIFETDQLFIPLLEESETKLSMSYRDCQDWCLYNRTECIGIELSNSTCTLFMSDERQSYKRFQSNTTTAMAPCWQDGAVTEPVYFHIFDNKLLNTQAVEITTSNWTVLTSVGYPFRYDVNQIHRWIIHSARGTFISLQFTDISIKPNDQFNEPRRFQNNELCKDVIIVTKEETPRNSSDSKAIIFIMDYKYNGKYPKIPVQYSTIILEFRTCTRMRNDHQTYRGFSVYVLEEDLKQICAFGQRCRNPPIEFLSGSFLGYLPEEDMKYRFSDSQSHERNIILELLDFDVSCSSGTQFGMKAYASGGEKTYCNGNRPYGEIIANGFLFMIRYSAAIKSCGQVLFKEGFRLSFKTLGRNHKLLNLTTSQTELIDDLPVMMMYGYFPVSSRDVRRFMLNRGRIRKVCSQTFKKCYTIHVGMVMMSWIDALNMCTDRNKTLVAFRSKLEMEYVRQAVLAWLVDINISTLRMVYFYKQLFIGLNLHTVNTQQYRDYWSDGSLAGFTAWDENEPQDVAVDHHCTSMSLSENQGWRTEPCFKAASVNIVCESPMELSVTKPKESLTQLLTNSQSDANALITVQHLLFKCNNGEYVSRLAKCNGVGECIDGSDEQDCLEEDICADDEFQCDSGGCIHVSHVCDRVQDCNDLSDESCEYETCSDGYNFQCDGGICHNLNDFCDGVIHCKDGSDESNCKDCKRGLFRCVLSNKCLPKDYVCDGLVDCNDASDEANCSTTIKTCEDLLASGISESGMKLLDGKYIQCDFEEDEFGNPINHTMTYFNVDWLHLKGAEYDLEPHEFIRNALASGYACSQKFRQQSRRSVNTVNELLNLTATEEKEVVLQYNSFEEESNASTDTFKVHLMPTALQLRYFDMFDVENIRITIGPVTCTKDSKSSYSKSISCGNGIRPVDESRRCLYSIDSAFHMLNGCITLNHLQDCAEFVCPEGYVKCPGSYCIYSHHVCNGYVDCLNGEDERNCWCANDEKTILIFIDMMTTTDYQQKAYKLAGKMYSENRTVMVFTYRSDFGYMIGQLIKSNSGRSPLRYVNEYVVNYIPGSTVWETWSFDNLLGLHEILTSSKTYVLIWISDSKLSEIENAMLNHMMKFIHSNKGVSRLYNVRVDQFLKTKTKIVSSAVTEVFVPDWAVLDAAGPLLFTEECTSLNNTRCSRGYRCLLSRVCLPIDKLCDGSEQCPEGDDEMNCVFKCPSSCTCGLLAMKCSDKDVNGTFPLLEIHSSTRSLDLSSSKTYGKAFLTLHSIDVDYRSLVYLNISECEIAELFYSYFSRINNLKTLDLSYNRLTRLASSVLSQLTHLTSLYLHGNSLLTYIEPGALTNLKIRALDLTGCSLSTISINTFEGLNMNELDLSFNEIDNIEDNAFNRLSLKHLKIHGNRISLFTKQMFNGLIDLETINTPAYKFCCIRPSYLKEESCLPYKDEFSSCSDLMRYQTLKGLLWTIGSLALIGNILSLLYRITFDKKRLKIGYGIFVTNLAISDLLMGIYLFVIAIADRVYKDRYIEVEDYWRSSNWCRLAGVLSTLSSETSVLFIAFITIDRILVIKFPFGNFRFTVRMAVVASVVCWVSGLFLSVLPLIYVEYFSDGFYSKSAVCLALPLTRDRPPGWLYSISIFIGFNCVMFVLIATGQLLIYLEIKKQTSEKKRMNVTRRNDLKVARNLLLLVTTDFLCWFPIGCMGIMAINGYNIPGEVYAWTAVLVLPVNSALNPFLYTFSAIISSKAFNPSLDEQKHEDLSKETGKTVVRILSLLSHRGQKSGQSINLADRVARKPLRMDELVLITAKIIRVVSCLHDEHLILKTLDKENVIIQMSPHGNKIRNVYLNQQPYVSSGKLDKAENIFSLGCLIGDCIESVGNHD